MEILKKKVPKSLRFYKRVKDKDPGKKLRELMKS